MKRLLAVVLTLAMLMSMLPSISFAAGTAEDLKYEFTLAGAGETATETNSLLNNAGRKFVSFGIGNDGTEAGDDWSFAGASGNYVSTDMRYTNQLTPDGFWWYGKTSTGPLGTYGVTFKIVIPENGTYIPTVKYLPYKSEGELHAYIIDDAINGKEYSGNSWAYNFETTTAVDKEGEANTSTGYLANSLKAGGSMPNEMTFLLSGDVTTQTTVPTSSDAVALVGEPITLDAGTYYLFIAGNTNRYFPYLHSFELTVPIKVTEIEATVPEAMVGNKISPSVVWKNGDKVIDGTLGKVKIEIAEDENDILVSDDSGNIYAKAAGTATVRVTGTLNETSASDVVEVTVFADSGYAGVNKASYLFTSAAYEDSLLTTSFLAEEMNEETFTKECKYQEYGIIRPWAMVAAKVSRPNSGGEYFQQNDRYLDLSTRPGEWVAFKVKVPKSGKYTVDVSGYTYATGGLAEIYMLPYNEDMTFADITENIDVYASSENFVAEADFNGTAKAPVMQTSVGRFTASDALDYEKGYADYLMIVKTETSPKSSAGVNVLINSVMLVGQGGIANAEVAVTDSEIGVGEYTGIANVVAKNSADNELDLSDAYISHSVAEDDRDILELCNDGVTFKAIGEGKATIKTLILIEGSAYEKETEINVKNDVKVSKVYLYSTSVGGIGRELKFATRLELNNRKLIAAGEIVSYEIVSQSADKVVELEDNGTKVIGAGVGTAEIKATLLVRGVVHETDTITVTVEEEGSVRYPTNFTIDLRKNTYTGDTAARLNEIVKYSEYRNWIFHDFSSPSGSYPNIGLVDTSGSFAQIVWSGLNDSSYLAFKVKFETPGEYAVDVTGYCRERAAKLELYILPATEENISGLKDKLVTDNEYYFGAADTYRAEKVTDEVNSFGTGLIEQPGEYLVVFKAVKGQAAELYNGYGDAWYPLYISFANQNSMSRAELTLESGEDKIEVGETANVVPVLFSGENEEIEYSFEDLEGLVFNSDNTSVATVDKNGLVTGLNEGKATITAIFSYDDITTTASIELEVEDTSGIDMEQGITASYDESIYVYGATKIELSIVMNSGKTVKIPSEYITWNVTGGEDAADVAPDGTVTGKKIGKTVISPVVDPTYKTDIDKLSIAPVTVNVVWDSTINPAIYTIKERENAIKNASRYDWAKREVEAVKKNADKYVENLETLYERMIPEGLPRYYHVGHKYDPLKFFCRYCGCNIGLEYGSYGWSVNMLSRPWKVQCPDCKCLFPSNDFGSFYELGITESGVVWSYSQALQKHHEMFVCEHIKAGQECTHERPIDSAPTPGSAEWVKNDPRDDKWYEFYGYNVKGGYLNNDLYADMDAKLSITGWGVDDGFGYQQPYISDKTLPGYNPSYYENDNGKAWYQSGSSKGPVQHTYIAYYLHEGIWHGSTPNSSMVINALTTLKDAFVYTSDAKYGRAGVILLDRVADFYPGFNWKQWEAFRGDAYRGKILDPVWELSPANTFAECYDAFIPIYNDPYVIEYLSEKEPRYEVDEDGNWKRDENDELIPLNLKDSPGALRRHIEENILLEIYDSAIMSEIAGNIGMTKKAVTAAALALNRMPETGEMLDWIFKPGKAQSTSANPVPRTGGGLLQHLVESVDRDGNGDENAPGYNRGWCGAFRSIADMLAGYELYPSVDLYKNVKFRNMFLAQARLTLGGYYGAQTGDSGAFASSGIVLNDEACLDAFKYTGDREIARALYMYNGNTAEGLRGSIFDDEPEQLARDIERIVKEDGEYKLESDMMTGYGFAALRAGAKHNSASSLTATNTNRDFAIYFGGSGNHGHIDTLNLYASAFGLNIAPDIGYPEQTGAQPNRYEWVATTISHNTVVVNEKQQKGHDVVQKSHHFDDSGRVKVMDISAEVYEETDEYRRSLVMVEVDDEISYGVDFFHVSGGDDHMYSFHSQSDEISAVSGLSDMQETPMYEDAFGNLYGTYAGPDVKYGPDPGGLSNAKYPRGFTWLKNIRTFKSIENDFSVEFKVKDWKKVLPQKRDIRLRLTMVNDDPMEEVTFATAVPPKKSDNINVKDFEYVLVRNKGSNLDTTFTTVLEPYEAGNKYIRSIEKLSMVRDEAAKPGTGDSYGAVKVTHENGRIDYVIYSTNNEIDYVVDDNINFRGFAGVLSFDGEASCDALVYSYLNDGEVLKFVEEEKEEALSAYTGTVKSFTDELEMENRIVYTPTAGQNVDVEALSGKYVYVENGGVDNSVYRIERAEYAGDDIVLDIGTVSVIRSYVDANDIDRGYVYNVAQGQSLRIPISAITSRAPVVENPGEHTTSAGSSITIPIKAESMSGKELTLIGTTLPRGMTVNRETNTLTWKPDSSQIGENHVAITASDGMLETTVHFTVMVYGSTTGSTSSDDKTEDSGTSSEGTGAAGGGGGGGGGASDTAGGNETDVPDTGDETENGEQTGEDTEASPGGSASGEDGFVDLHNHEWASDAISSLAEDGIIKGTSASTFSPANNITRADFASLLVRAFKLRSDNTENFADVQAGDYFAPELAIARNTGIVNGIGDNKYAPRNTITRQDMMVIVYRALQKLNVGLGDSDEPEYEDFGTVADYAKPAVSALISAGIVNGKSGRIAPTDYTTRAEIAVLIKRIMDYMVEGNS